MRAQLGVLSLLLLLLSAAACGDTREARLGASGEACLADADCRGELICEQRLCVDPLLGVSYDADCEGVCQWIDACGLVEDNCLSECRAETQGWTAEGADQAFACLLSLECGELGQVALTRECKDLAR